MQEEGRDSRDPPSARLYLFCGEDPVRPDYVVKRFGTFLLIVWLAATVNFFLPRLGGGNPVRDTLMQQAAQGGSVQLGMEDMIAEYDKKFGLDRPLWQQYLTYLGDMSRFDFNYSIANYPQRVI